jgi:hypothetical protein
MNIVEKIKSAVGKPEQPNISPLRFHQYLNLGCDPEFFLTSKDGAVIGSEKVLPKDGLKAEGTYGKIIIDGVQAEINPLPSTCRQSLAYAIGYCFGQLNRSLEAQGLGQISVKTDPLVDVSQTEMDSLSERSKIFGCDPSMNVHEKGQSKIEADPKKYLKRSAGGHIHLGFIKGAAECYKDVSTSLKNIDVMVPMLDIIVGNTCVLLDRDPNNIERRKNYGKVGEFRLKEYGLEYRTLSNFWLRSYTTMSFVMGLARMAVHFVEQSSPTCDYVAAIFGAVDMKDIIKAIQENDFDLAMSNFKKIAPIIVAGAGAVVNNYPINRENIDTFYYVVAKGLDAFIPNTPFKNWMNYHLGRDLAPNRGWEFFCTEKRDEAMIWKEKQAIAFAGKKAKHEATKKLAVEVESETIL